MQCMKCGRDLEAGEVFCKECREVMAKYPVKPGTVVQLPHHSAETAPKKTISRRRAIPPEEQLVLLKRMTRKMALALVVSMFLCVGLGYFAITQYLENRNKQALGQNYYVATTASVPSEAQETTVPSTPAE